MGVMARTELNLRMRRLAIAVPTGIAIVLLPVAGQSQGLQDLFNRGLQGLNNLTKQEKSQTTAKTAETSSPCGEEDETRSAGLGALLGGVAGKYIGESNLAAAGGALLGSALAGLLDCRDQAEVNGAVARSLDESKDEETRAVTTSSGGKQVTVTPRKTTTEARNVAMVRDARVKPAAAEGMEIDGGYYRLRGNYNLFADATPSAPVLRTLKKGQAVQVMGRVKSGQWMAIGGGGALIGYMAADAVDPTPLPTQSQTRVTAKKAGDDAIARRREAVESRREAARRAQKEKAAEESKTLYYSGETVREAQELLSDDVDLEANEVEVKTTCRTVEVSVEGATNSSKLCKASDGVWEF